MAYTKIEHYDEEVTQKLALLYKEVLHLIGEDPEREGLQLTPIRVARISPSL